MFHDIALSVCALWSSLWRAGCGSQKTATPLDMHGPGS